MTRHITQEDIIAVIKQLRSASRAELAAQLGVAPPRLGPQIKKLMERGAIYRSGEYHHYRYHCTKPGVGENIPRTPSVWAYAQGVCA